jgi:phospholipase D1/2
MAEAGGPRQPWHDWHCKIEGPAAYDILTNFEQRWRKATRWHDDELIQLERISWILSPKQPQPPEGDPDLYVTEHDAKNTWHVQVFRSIDSGSARGFPKNVVEAEKQHLIWGKNIAIDISIQMAYIKAIRSAQHFVYIENQYFIGSSYNWPDYTNAGEL